MKQWRYLEELQAQVETGRVLTQAETAKRIGCTAATVSIWNRDLTFCVEVSRILNTQNDPLVPLLQRALFIKGIQGQKWAAELALRTRGLLDNEPLPAGMVGTAAGPGGGATAIAQVSIVGIVGLPTREAAAAIGANTIHVPPAAPPELLAANAALAARGVK